MNLPFDEVLARIETVDDDETAQIMEAVQKRFSAAFPDWEAIYLSCPKHDRKARQETSDYLMRLIWSLE